MNEEYSQQMTIYQREKDEKEKEYRDKLKMLKKDTETIKIDYTPEMIPPEQTLKIFLHFIKHLQYEEMLYKKYISRSDIKHLKVFLNKLDADSHKVNKINLDKIY
jgi:hypothetical protein